MEISVFELSNQIPLNLSGELNLSNEIIPSHFNVSNNTTTEIYNGLDTLCSICREQIKNNDVVKKIKKCNHFYHLTCIDKWFERKSTCPVCRKDVGVEEPVLDFTLPRSSRRRRTVRDDLFASSTFQERHNYYRLQLERERARYRRWQFSTRNNTYWS